MGNLDSTCGRTLQESSRGFLVIDRIVCAPVNTYHLFSYRNLSEHSGTVSPGITNHMVQVDTIFSATTCCGMEKGADCLTGAASSMVHFTLRGHSTSQSVIRSKHESVTMKRRSIPM